MTSPVARRCLLAWLTAFALVPGVRAQVTPARITSAAQEPGAWLTYSGTYDGHRYSPLAEITPDNVARLRPTWVYQAEEAGGLQTTPLVADGVMYITEALSRVAALDVRSGSTARSATACVPCARRARRRDCAPR